MRPKYWNILHCGAMFLESDYSSVIAVQRYAQLNRYQLKGPRILLQGEIGNRIEAIPVNTERAREMSAVTVYTKPNCVQCKAAFRALDKAGIDYTAIVKDASAVGCAQDV